MKKITLLMLLMTTSLFAQLEGSWSFSPEAGAMGVGPNPGDYGWWSNTADDVATRSCLFDDEYEFNADGSFTNVQGADTWLEGWQAGTPTEGCGAAIAPHDGSIAATYTVDATAGTVTIVGSGAYLGLSKVTNQGEDGVATADTKVYSYVLSEDGATVDFTIQGFNGTAEWIFKMTKNSDTAGVEDFTVSSVKIYPNPSSSNWNFKTANTVITSVDVYNIVGKRVVSQKNNSSSIAVSAQGLATGIYIARVTTTEGTQSMKLIKN